MEAKTKWLIVENSYLQGFLLLWRVWPAGPSAWAEAEEHSAKGLSYRVLGKTGFKVTSVGFGCMVTSDASVIERAADMGINYFDTCRNYQHGNNERLVATGLKGKRQKIYLSSKTDGQTKEAALAELDTSLQRAGDRPSGRLVPAREEQSRNVPDELFEAQQIALQQGKIRFTGVSTHNAKEMVPFLVNKGATDVVLATFNFTMEKAFPTPWRRPTRRAWVWWP